MRPTATLDAVNFSLAGAREGFGPFLGVYLQARGFDPALTGFIMSLAAASGLVLTTPIGTLIDRTERKRSILVLAVAAIAIGALAIVATGHLWLIAAAQILIGIGDTAIAPLVAAITLGVVGLTAFGRRTARNEAFNHAGNAVNAAFAASLGYAFGLGYVALAIVVMAVASSVAIGRLSPEAIDHTTARSGEQDDRSTFAALFANRRLLLLAAAVLLFQTANGAMLPFLAQARTAAGSDPSLTTGVMTVVARLLMVVAAIYAPRIAARRSYAGVMTVAVAITVLRGGLAFFATSWLLVLPVQMLEGLAMGLGSVAIPALSAEVMSESGRASAGLGVVLTAFGVGATFSPLIAGFVAQRNGFPAAFLVLAAIAFVGVVLWTLPRILGPLGFAPAASAGDAG